MVTTTHVLLNTVLLGRKDIPERNGPIILGALLPDVPGFLCLCGKIAQYFWNGGLWDTSYYSASWLPWVDWAHSIPLALAGILLFHLIKYRFGFYFCASMALHDLEDLFVHSERAHSHFIPFSHYRFISPISCLEPRYHAAWVAPMEWALLLACTAILWRRDPPPWVKWTLAFICLAHGIGLIHFLLVGIHQVPS
jgi:hypothetical protein